MNAQSGGASRRGSHRLAQISQCERAWYLSWVRKLQSRDLKAALVEGTAVHSALAYWWAARMATPPEWFHERTLVDQLAKDTVGMPEAATLALHVRDAYDRYYAPTERWEPFAVEQEYTATVGELFTPAHLRAVDEPFFDEVVSSRIDLMVRVNGRLWAVDHKTTKGAGSTLSKWNPNGEFASSFQFLLQTLILRKVFGSEFAGVVVQRIKTSQPYDFDRNVVHLPSQVLFDAPVTVLRQVKAEAEAAKNVREAHASGLDLEGWLPKGNFWSCWSYGRNCDFRPLCAAEPHQRGELVKLEYQPRR